MGSSSHGSRCVHRADEVSSPGMAYWMVACSVYLYIAALGVTVRICREDGYLL